MAKDISPTGYRFQQNTSGKTTVSTVQNGMDPAALAESLRSEMIEALQKDKVLIENNTNRLAYLSSLEAHIRNFQSVNQTLANVSNQANIFQNTLANLGSVNGIAGSEFLSVSTTGSAPFLNKAYDVQIMQLAKKDTLSSGKAFTDLTTAAGLSESIHINGVEIALSGTDSLTSIIEKINAETNNTGVEASYAFISSDIGYRLKLSSVNTATPINLHGTHSAHFTSPGLGFSSTADFGGDPAALLAHKRMLQSTISVDGITYYRDTNVLQDVIDGLAFTLQGKMDGPTQLSFKSDSSQILTQVDAWVKAVNGIKAALSPHMIKENKETTLYGEAIVADTLEMLKKIAQGAKGIPLGSRYSTEFSRFEFAQTKDDYFGGDLSYDKAKLKALVSKNPLAFAKMMGNYCEYKNPNLNITAFPDILSNDFAAKDVTLVVAKTLSGGYEATLTCGDITETVQTARLGIFTFQDAFKGISLQYTKDVDASETTTLNFTQGTASIMNTSLKTYLSDDAYKGILSRTKKSILQNKEDLTTKIAEAQQKADRAYETNIQKLQKPTQAAENTKLYLKLLEGLRGNNKR